MIELITEPALWSSAYEKIIYEFKKSSNIGPFDVTDNYTFNKRVIQAGASKSLFVIGTYIKITIGFNTYFVKILAYSGTDVVIDLPLAYSSITGCPVELVSTEPLNLKLKIGRIANSVPMTEFVSIKAVSKNQIYKVDISGFIQDYFGNIDKPPVIGYDPDLYCNFQLVGDFGYSINIGEIRNSVYSTIEGIDSTAYVVGPEPLKSNSTIEKFNGQLSIFSRIIGNFIKTYLE
jgi:hypothetical protein